MSYESPRPVSEYSSLNKSTVVRHDSRSSEEWVIKTAQLEYERKLRKETEERCRQLTYKVEHTQAILNLRNGELEKERNGRKEAELMCQSLKTTIDKLEQYLKKKNTVDGQHFIPESNTNISMSEITRLQDQLHIRDTQDDNFQNAAHQTETSKPKTVQVAASIHTKDDSNSTCQSLKFRDFRDNELEF
ncbi:uncharacterized protein LOC125660704 isoform X2 [Ostrea edulis]|uniref:uncharacterized protein LOC125660704 isoform X2 n=1 Tax=Ostrea edulis TaxID=37623 RepID=UPI0024AECF4F|nr:uncharacterized protein LOC125660704 isoform X2 [Ostrea edulis]